MNHKLLILPFLLCGLSLSSCEKHAMEKAGKKADAAVDKAADKVEEVTEKAKDKVDEVSNDKPADKKAANKE